ncbi:MAG: transglutaminase domain-containing protein [Phycisphaeraceae bacterium]|nr:transglutaminase domain-containing protein [Phycisphaeraceae bacterium]
MKDSTRFPLWLTSILVAVLALSRSGLASIDDYERWYAVELGGNRVGWMHQKQSTVGDLITTSSRMEFAFNRDQAGAKISVSGSFVETKSGKPVSMSSMLKFGRQPTSLQATFGENEIEVIVTQSGRTERSTRPLPDGTWLTPAAASEFVKQRMHAGADSITVRTMSALAGMDPMSALKPTTVERSGRTDTDYEVAGKKVKATKWTTTSSASPSTKATEVVDEAGLPLATDTSMGMMKMVMRIVNEEEAKAEFAAPEIMVETFITPDKPIANPRKTKKATYLLHVAEGEVPAIPATGSQRVSPVDASSVRVVVDTRSLSPAPEGDATNPLFLACPINVNCNDPEIRNLLTKAIEKAADNPAARAEAIRAFVYRHIHKKDLDVGFASASEVARTRQGDCSEHGVLTAALLRANAIPSRVVAGVVYADQFAGGKDIFAYHMWTQALLDVDGKPTWVDLDATLPPNIPYDATHIALATASLGEDDTQESLASIVLVMGRLKISVESAE